MGQLASKIENKPRIVPEAIEDDLYKRVLLNASTLHCPICIEIFSGAPLMLSCGHSFCDGCLRRLPLLSPSDYDPHNRANKSNFFIGRCIECPLCRQRTYAKRGTTKMEEFVSKNYVLENILDDIRALSNDRESYVVFDETLKFENKRLHAVLAKKDEEINKLKASLEEKSSYTLILQCLTLVLGAFVIRLWIFPDLKIVF